MTDKKLNRAITTAALIIAFAMLGYTVIDYFTYREAPEPIEVEVVAVWPNFSI